MNPLWSLPRLWPGGECYILGGGPSLGLVDINRLWGRRVIAVNDAYRIAPWADVMFCADRHWLVENREGLAAFPGLKMTACSIHRPDPDVRLVHRDMSTPGLSTDPTRVRWNRSSGACAINIAVHFGVKRIVLLGFDMRRVDGQKHWHPDVNHDPGNPYPRFLEVFPVIARDAEALGIEIVNATPESALTVFPVLDPAELGIGRAREAARC